MTAPARQTTAPLNSVAMMSSRRLWTVATDRGKSSRQAGAPRQSWQSCRSTRLPRTRVRAQRCRCAHSGSDTPEQAREPVGLPADTRPRRADAVIRTVSPAGLGRPVSRTSRRGRHQFSPRDRLRTSLLPRPPHRRVVRGRYDGSRQPDLGFACHACSGG